MTDLDMTLVKAKRELFDHVRDCRPVPPGELRDVQPGHCHMCGVYIRPGEKRWTDDSGLEAHADCRFGRSR